ncbi:MAG: molecular chaperone HtpG [Oscillospiraceae bacterium]|nr:molecular chaperone HtpG [Oscillospiraceae bacterium]
MAKKQFKTESKRILDLMINSIYTHPEIFLRELISNASDAIDKLCYISLTDENVGLTREDFRIRLDYSEEERYITVDDNGVGMTKEELENNLGVIAKSGTLKFRQDIAAEGEAQDVETIGQFGVGFYSAFMVSDKVTVISKAYNSEKAYKWESTGIDGYTIDECEKEGFGTHVILHIKPDAEEREYTRFLNEFTLSQLVKKYSDYIRWPIKLRVRDFKDVPTGQTDSDGKPETKLESIEREDTINSMVPIWKRDKSEVKEEELDEFYQNLAFDYEKPLSLVRVNAEGQVSYRAMVFIPGRMPTNFFTSEFKPGLQLYSSGVMIMEACEDVVPEAFRFVRGVVDSPDFSLNISREMLQHSRQLTMIRNNLEKKISSELQRLMNEEPEKYETFWAAFGVQIKYAMLSKFGDKRDLLRDLLMFYSSREKKLIPLREYKEKMPEEQKKIYYVCTDNIARAENLPQTEAVRDKGYEVLYMTDDVDDFVIRRMEKFEDIPFCDVTTDDLGFESGEEKAETEAKQEENRQLLDFIKELLGEKVETVRLSHKLKSHPVYLTTDGDISLEMEKYFVSLKNEMSAQIKAKRVLELNASHRAFEALREAYETDRPRAEKLAKILYAQALLIAGLTPEDPTEYTELICELF